MPTHEDPEVEPCPGCGSVSCPTGGQCPDLTSDDYYDPADEARARHEDQYDDPDPDDVPGAMDEDHDIPEEF